MKFDKGYYTEYTWTLQLQIVIDWLIVMAYQPV